MKKILMDLNSIYAEMHSILIKLTTADMIFKMASLMRDLEYLIDYIHENK